MLRTIFTKTLYERRWMMLWWSVAGAALVVFIVLMFPTFKDALGESLTDVPESLKNLIGDTSAYSNLPGYLDLQVFEQMVFLGIIAGAILCTGLIAGEENDGKLQTLLAMPVSRTRVYLEKLAASVVIIGVITSSLAIGSYVGALIIDEPLDLGKLLVATLGAWLVSMALSLLGYAIGAGTGKRGLAGTITGLTAFLAFLIPALAEGVKALRPLEKFSPFYYFDNPVSVGPSGSDLAILLGACVVIALVGYLGFVRRDVYQS